MIKKILYRDQHIKLDCNSFFLEKRAGFNYETEVYDLIDILTEKSIFIDIGAAEGLFTCYGALKGMNVFSVEPDIMNFNLLSRNVSLNEVDCKLFNIGIADLKGTEVLKIGMPFEGGHQKVLEKSSRKDLDFDFKTSVVVNIDTLDNFIEDNSIHKIDLLKIDVDGSEEGLIKGSKKALMITELLIIELHESQSKIKDKLHKSFIFQSRHKIPNEDSLYNYIFKKSKL